VRFYAAFFMPPFVSVILPSYNHAQFLERRMESILAQTFRDFELIVLDDASSDESAALLARYAKRTPLHLEVNAKNSGSPFLQWKRGAELAQGTYLWVAESDDYADARLLEVLVERVRKNPNVGLAYCQSWVVDGQNEVSGRWQESPWLLDPRRWDHDFINDGVDEAGRFLVLQNTIPNASAVLVRRELFLEALKGAEGLSLAGDWWTWARVLMHTDVAFVAEPLNFFRCHDHSVRETVDKTRICEEVWTVVAHICSRMGLPADIRHRSFENLLHFWGESLMRAPFPPDPKRLLRMHACGLHVNRGATRRMGRMLLKLALMKAGLIPTQNPYLDVAPR
jgi:hypothetical protein